MQGVFDKYAKFYVLVFTKSQKDVKIIKLKTFYLFKINIQEAKQKMARKKISMDGRPVEHEVVRSVNAYIVCYLLLFIISVVAVSVDNHDLVTGFSSVMATINNIGPGLNMVGPTQNFSFFSDTSKIVLIFDMLAGRLELFPMLLLFSPATWRKH